MDPDQAAGKSNIDLTWVMMMMMLHTVCPQYARAPDKKYL